MAAVNQCEAVLSYIRRHGSITPLEALQELGVGRLAARINDLREQGHAIASDMVDVQTRAGQSRVARYTLTAGRSRGDMGSPESDRPEGMLFDTQRFIVRP